MTCQRYGHHSRRSLPSEENPVTRKRWSLLKKKMKGQAKEPAGGAVDESLPASVGDSGSIPGLGRFHLPWSS